MKRVADHSIAELADALKTEGIFLHVPPFVVSLKSDCSALVRDLYVAYADFEISRCVDFADFYINIELERGFRYFIKRLARFFFDGRPSFVPLPADQAFTMFEWGLNWCIAAHAHQYLIIHAAVIERRGKGVILPAPPGSGKSTLCAALVNSGWRLLSDELALLDMRSGLIFGMARPVNLKNKSIEVVSNAFPRAVLTQPVPDTAKGTIALMKPPSESVTAVSLPVRATHVVLPSFVESSDPVYESNSRAKTFMLLAEQSFNYDIHGVRGFHALKRLIEQCDCRNFQYSRLGDAIDCFEAIAVQK